MQKHQIESCLAETVNEPEGLMRTDREDRKTNAAEIENSRYRPSM
jgi:hypothetical protein